MTGPTARISQILREGPAPEPPAPPAPGDPCCVPECQADTRRGTLQGGAPMLCEGYGHPTAPCIAVWLVIEPEHREDYLDWVRAQAG